LCEVENFDMNSVPTGYNTDAGDEVELKPFTSSGSRVSIMWHCKLFYCVTLC